MAETNPLSRCDDASDVAFMRLAIEQAHVAGAIGEVPVGAVVVCDGHVIARGYNRREVDTDPSAHAEFRALIEASRALGRWRLTGCTVYVTLEPCLMCAGLMQLARIDRCVFGATDPKGGALGTLFSVHDDERLNHRFEVAAGICEQECSALLSRFFSSLRAGRAESATLPAPAENSTLPAPAAPPENSAPAEPAPLAPAESAPLAPTSPASADDRGVPSP